MSEESEMIVPVLADILREWIRGDPLLEKHFFIHKQRDLTQIRMSCDSMRVIAGTNYFDDHLFPHRWYIGIRILDLHPANPEFFDILGRLLKHEHNRFNNTTSDCKITL